MRIVLVLALAGLVLPFTGCAKKKDESTTTASNNQNDSEQNYDDETGDGHAGEDGFQDDGGDGGHGDPGDGDGGHSDPDSGMPEEFADGGGGESDGHSDPDSGMTEEFADGGGDEPDGHSDPDSGMTEEFAEGGGKSQNREAFSEGNDGDGGHGDEGHSDGTGKGPRPAKGDHGDGVDMPGDMPEEFDPGAGDNPGEGGGGGGNQNPSKPTDVPGVKEGTAEYAAVDLLLRIGNSESEGLQSLIAEDAAGLLKKLRSDPEKTFPEAKETIGLWKPKNSRLGDRETIVFFQNNKEKILQLHVRRIQGEYRVRDLRVLEAVNRTPTRRRK